MSEQRKKIFQKKLKKMPPKTINGTIVVKKLTEDLASVSTGNTAELKVRFTGQLGLGEEFLADIEGLVIKGPPDDIRNLMATLNLDTIDEGTKITIHKNLQTRLDESTPEKE